MPERRKLLVLALCLLGGVLLIISGTHGPGGIYVTILEKLPMFITDSGTLAIVRAVALILLGLSSLGGLAVIIGGLLIYMKHVSTGKIMIGFGSGAAIPWLLLLVLTILNTSEAMTVIAQQSVTSWIGIFLSIAARILAK